MTKKLQKNDWEELVALDYKPIEFDESKEVWKLCDDYPGNYISNYGRVKRDSYTYHYKNGKRKNFKPIIKKLTETSKRKGAIQGYLCTRMIDSDGNSKCEMVHRLVAKAFIPNPNNLPTVNHKNGNKHDNRVENLEWNSYSDNNQHAYANGLKSDNIIMLQVDQDNYIKQIYFSEEYAALCNYLSTKSIRNSSDKNTLDYYNNKWIRFYPNKYKITVDDNATEVRNGGFGSTTK